jgi:hypothetical protein
MTIEEAWLFWIKQARVTSESATCEDFDVIKKTGFWAAFEAGWHAAALAQPEPWVKTYCGGKPNYTTQPEPEPVAWADKYDIDREGHDFWVNRQRPAEDGVPLYTAPPKREWVELTDDEGAAIWGDAHDIDWKRLVTPKEIVKRISDRLKEKNGG